MVALVPITPTLETPATRVAASTPGSITPHAGTEQRSSNAGIATAEAVLHATTRASTPWPHRNSAIPATNSITISGGLRP